MSKPIFYDKLFLKNYRDRIKGKKQLKKAYLKALAYFLESEEHPAIKNHKLEKRKKDLSGYRAFSVTEEIRVIYKSEADMYYFHNIGTHEQVYKIKGRKRRL